MEITWEDYKAGDNRVTFTIKLEKINGVYTSDKNLLSEVIGLKENKQGTIKIDNKRIPKEEIKKYKKAISVIKEEIDSYIEKMKVYEAMYYEIRRKSISLKDPSNKVKESLKIVGLNYDYLNRNIRSLSSSEKKQFQLAMALLSNPRIIVIIEPFINYDKETEKKLWFLLQKMKEQYNKTIIFLSDDETMLYKYTDYLIVMKNKKVIAEGKPLDVFKKVSYLKKNSIEIPEIVEITILAKNKKGINIDYHKDVRDIIKDIYKHV